MVSLSRIPFISSLSENATGLVFSCILHGLLVAFIIVGWHPPEKKQEVARPRFIEAKLLQMKPAVAQPKPAKPQEQPKPKVDVAAQRRAEEQKRQQQAKAEADKKRAETQRLQAQRDKERKEQARRELERQEQIKQQQAEKQRQEEIRRQQEIKRQQDLARALALEDEMLEDAQVDAQVGTYTDYMASLIASNWSRPPSARRGMEVTLEISLGTAGRVTSVQIAKASGNPAFDRSAEQAVWKVNQFSRLKEMDPGLYQREFRKIFLVFRPDDLRM